MNKTRIDWGIPGLLTWNPVTGCKNRCPWCYANRNWNRLHRKREGCEFTDLKFYPNRINEPLKIKKPSTIFVGSMSDLEFWKTEWVNAIIGVCLDCPQHTFMFLSKSSDRYFDFQWPENTMKGLTITGAGWNPHVLHMASVRRAFISIEPLLGKIETFIPLFIERVIVGAMTGPGAVAPKKEWIQSIKDNISAKKIYWKPSIRKYL